jgi:hypothetical protein
MTMNKNIPTSSGRSRHRFRNVTPGAAADAELTWFFNEAEIAIDMPSNFLGLLTGVLPTSLEAVERRAEAMHSARKIYDWLQRIPSTDMRILAGFYTERPWSNVVNRALPGGLAGAAAASVEVRVEYARALGRAQTRAKNVVEFIEEVVRKGRLDLVAAWRDEVVVACATAVTAYERVRGDRPSVVPEDDG